jgi:hypothetical protein
MPVSNLTTNISTWYQSVIAGSSIWSAIGFAAVALLVLFIMVLIVRALIRGTRAVLDMIGSRRRKSTQGYGIGISPINGSGGSKQTKALMAALEDHLADFMFGAPFEVLKAPKLRAKGAKGLRFTATDWLDKAATDLIVWGERAKSKANELEVEVLSCEGSLTPSEAVHSEGKMPIITDENKATNGPVAAYLIARTLQPGLGNATAFKAEKLAPVADMLFGCLERRETLPERTQLTIETDYCAMALHLGSQEHLLRVAELRRARLSGAGPIPYEIEVPARIDLGQALMGLSGKKFDPVRVREAMDHLKAAVDLLRMDPNLQLAAATSAAVQRGQAMLESRQRFSVTGGGNL